MLHRPLRVPARAGFEVAGLRLHDAHVAFGKTDKTRVAIALGIALGGFASTGDAVDFTLVVEPDPAADVGVQIQQCIVQRQLVFDRRRQLDPHFRDIAHHLKTAPFEYNALCGDRPARADRPGACRRSEHALTHRTRRSRCPASALPPPLRADCSSRRTHPA